MKRKAIMIVALLLAVGGSLAASGFFSNRPRGAQLHTVELREGGYSPSTLTAQVGDTVRFSTRLDKPFWPASDPHPTHETYAEFDPGRPLQPEEEWTYVFLKPGRWGFHDHLDPLAEGTITVTGDEPIDEQDSAMVAADCEAEGNERAAAGHDEQDYLTCWKNKLRAVIKASGFSSGMEMFERTYDESEPFRRYCHIYAHVLGEGAYKEIARGRDIAWTTTIDQCNFGFYHGLMQEMVSHGRDHAFAANFCDTVNERYDGTEKSVRVATCYHGIGHGLVYERVEEDPGADQRTLVSRALEFCRGLKSNTHVYHECAAGVFGGIESLYFGVHGIRLEADQNEPFSICRGQDESYLRYCYNALVPYVYSAFGIEKLMRFIEKIDHEPAATLSAEHIGTVFGNYERTRGAPDTKEVVMRCREFRRRALVAECINGVAFSLIQGNQPKTVYEGAMTVCTQNGLSNTEENSCVDGIFGRLNDFSREELGRSAPMFPTRMWSYAENVRQSRSLSFDPAP